MLDVYAKATKAAVTENKSTEYPDATYALASMMKSGHHRTVFVSTKGYTGIGTDNAKMQCASLLEEVCLSC